MIIFGDLLSSKTSRLSSTRPLSNLDATCVNQCAALYLTLEDKSTCLEKCLCYADPQERALLN